MAAGRHRGRWKVSEVGGSSDEGVVSKTEGTGQRGRAVPVRGARESAVF